MESSKGQNSSDFFGDRSFSEISGVLQVDTSAPKGIGQGITAGVGNIVGGAVGAAGIAVMAPTLGMFVVTCSSG